MDFFSSDTPVEELQRPIFISEEKLWGVWVIDMTTNAVLLPMMHSVCPTCSVSVMTPPACLADVFSCLLVDRCTCLPIYLSYCSSVCLSACPRVILYLGLYACPKLKKYNVILLPLPLTSCPNNGCNVQFPGQCDYFTWSIHLLFWTTIVSLCTPTVVVVLHVPPLCLWIGFTFVVSLNAFVARSFGCSLCGIVLWAVPRLLKQSCLWYMQIIIQQQSSLRWSIIIWH